MNAHNRFFASYFLLAMVCIVVLLLPSVGMHLPLWMGVPAAAGLIGVLVALLLWEREAL